MYTLYYAPGVASMAVHWALIELGVPHTLERLDMKSGAHRRPEYLALNPNGLVPTLLVDGRPVTETAAILALLAERHPEAGLAPAPGTPARAMYLQWLFHLSNTVQVQFRPWFFAREPAGEAHGETVKEIARGRLETTFERIDAHLATSGGYIAGESVSMADFLAVTLIRWARSMPRPATTWPAVGAYVARMKARPSAATLFASEGLPDWP